MMACAHALIGAAIGAEANSNEEAFTAGVISHGLADLVPHRDYDMPIEVPLLGLAMAGIALRYGINSRQFWGAVGGFSPDIENGFVLLGVLPHAIYPTHCKKKPWYIGHGHKVKSVLPQIILIVACFYFADKKRRG